jgi:hypothetical protein
MLKNTFKYILIWLILNLLIIFWVSANIQNWVSLNVWESKVVWIYKVTNTTDHKIYAPITDINWKVLWNTSINTNKNFGESIGNSVYNIWWFRLEKASIALWLCYAWWPVPCEVTQYYWEEWNWDSSCLSWIISKAVSCKNTSWTTVPSSNCAWLPLPTWAIDISWNYYIIWTCWTCWTANWTSLATKPTTTPQLCSAWTSTTVTWTWPWNWNCNWSESAINQDDVSCVASKIVIWVCWIINNSCTSWILSDTADTTTEYKWQCVWSNWWPNSSCSKRKNLSWNWCTQCPYWYVDTTIMWSFTEYWCPWPREMQYRICKTPYWWTFTSSNNYWCDTYNLTWTTCWNFTFWPYTNNLWEIQY